MCNWQVNEKNARGEKKIFLRIITMVESNYDNQAKWNLRKDKKYGKINLPIVICQSSIKNDRFLFFSSTSKNLLHYYLRGELSTLPGFYDFFTVISTTSQDLNNDVQRQKLHFPRSFSTKLQTFFIYLRNRFKIERIPKISVKKPF